MKKIFIFLFFFLIPVSCHLTPAHAACANPTGVAGDMTYNKNYRALTYCNGSSWIRGGQGIGYSATGVTIEADWVAGSNIQKGSDLTGTADGKSATGSFWVRRIGQFDQANDLYYTNGGGGFRIRFNGAANKLEIGGGSGNFTSVLVATTAKVFNDMAWHHIMFSFNVTGGCADGDAIYVDGVLDATTWSTCVNSNIDFTNAAHTHYFVGFYDQYADFWLEYNAYTDLSVSTTRLKFLDANGKPAYLGTDGSAGPTGAAPDIFLSGALSSWHTNKGTGGGFTLTNGPLTAAPSPLATSPSAAQIIPKDNLAHSALDLNTSQLAVKGNYLYVANAGDFAIVDISDPDNMSVTGSLTSVSKGGVAVHPTANYAYTCGWGGWDFKTIDISNPAAPAVVNTLDMSALGVGGAYCGGAGGNRIKIKGNTVYVAGNYGCNLITIDITNPAVPVFADEVEDGCVQYFVYPDNVAITDDGYAYISAGGGSISPSLDPADTGITVVDVQNPYNTSVVTKMTNVNFGNYLDHVALNPLNPNYLYACNSDGALITVDITNRASPSYVGYTNGTNPVCSDLVTVGTRLYYPGYSYWGQKRTIDVFDISTAAAPVAQAFYSSYNTAESRAGYGGIALANGYIFTGHNGDGVSSYKYGCGGPNGLEGDVTYNTTSNVMQYCDGESWVAMGPVPGAGGAGCANPAGNEGDIYYNTSYNAMQYCDGADWRWVGSPATGTTAGLVGWWKLDDTATPSVDSSASANNGTWAGTPTATTGILGEALSFNAGSDRIAIGDPVSGALDFGAGSFTYGMWVYVSSSLSTWDMPWYKGGASVPEIGYDFELGTGVWNANLSDGDEVNVIQLAAAPMLNQWVHLMLVVDRTAGKGFVYVNGALASSPNLSATLGSLSTAIGAYIGDDASNGNPFNGKIDDLRVYNRALSAGEVLEIYRLGVPQ